MQEHGVYGVFEDRVKSMYASLQESGDFFSDDHRFASPEGPIFEPVIASVMPSKASVGVHLSPQTLLLSRGEQYLPPASRN